MLPSNEIRNCRSSIVFRRSIIDQIKREKGRWSGRKSMWRGATNLMESLSRGGGRKSENEWRVVVRSEMCTWHASNACLLPRSLSIDGSLLRFSSSSSSPLGLWPTSMIVRGSNTRPLRGNFDLARPIGRPTFWRSFCFRIQESRILWGGKCVVVNRFFFLSFFFLKARSNCSRTSGPLETNRLDATRVCTIYFCLGFTNFSREGGCRNLSGNYALGGGNVNLIALCEECCTWRSFNVVFLPLCCIRKVQTITNNL